MCRGCGCMMEQQQQGGSRPKQTFTQKKKDGSDFDPALPLTILTILSLFLTIQSETNCTSLLYDLFRISLMQRWSSALMM